MTIYLDLIWLLNFIIDYMLLKLTAIALKRHVSKWRMLIGSLIASFIILLLFTPLSPIFYHPIGKLCYSVIIVLTVFGYRRSSLFIQSFFMFYFVTFVIGGGLFAVHFYVQSSVFYDHFLSFSTLRFGDPITWALVLLGFPLMWVFSKKRFEQVVVRKRKIDGLMGVKIKVFDNVINAIGLIDTGNQLSDPIRKMPVIFIHGNLARDIVPQTLLEDDAVKAFSDGAISDEWLSRISMIPYRGVSGKNELLLAFKPDELIIHHPDGLIQCKKVLIAFTRERLSVEDDFNCILHPDVIQLGTLATPAS